MRSGRSRITPIGGLAVVLVVAGALWSAPADEPAVRSSLARVLDRLAPQLASFAVGLVRTPSVNGANPEKTIAGLVADEARRLGLTVDVRARDPLRPCVVVSTRASGRTGLLLIGHLDTVPPGDTSLWKRPPFGGVVEGDLLYGRGAADNKGGIAAGLYALAALARVDRALHAGRATMLCVPDEENGATGTLGIRHLASLGLVEGVGAIYTYQGRTLVIGHRGLLRYRIDARGKAQHTGMSGYRSGGEPPRNAVTAMADLLLRLEKRVLPFSRAPYFDQYRPVITPGTTIAGGAWAGIVPDHSRAVVDVRTVPEFDREQMETVLREDVEAVKKCRPGIRFDLELTNHIPASISPAGAAVFSTLESVAEEVTHRRPIRKVCGPANEGYLLIQQGIPTVCGFGPEGFDAHGADEHVSLRSLTETALIYALTARDLSALVRR